MATDPARITTPERTSEDVDAALRYAAMIPSAKYGSVEVRPVMVMVPH